MGVCGRLRLGSKDFTRNPTRQATESEILDQSASSNPRRLRLCQGPAAAIAGARNEVSKHITWSRARVFDEQIFQVPSGTAQPQESTVIRRTCMHSSVPDKSSYTERTSAISQERPFISQTAHLSQFMLSSTQPAIRPAHPSNSSPPLSIPT